MAIFEEMSVKEDSGPRSMNDPDKISEKSHKLPSLTLYYRERCKKYKTSSFLQLKKKRVIKEFCMGWLSQLYPLCKCINGCKKTKDMNINHSHLTSKRVGYFR